MEFEYLYLASRGYLYRINLDKLSGGTAPPVELVVDFSREGMPIGMGVFSFNSKIYFVGGEIIKTDTTPSQINFFTFLDVLDSSRGDRGVSSDVYEFDPESKKISSSSDIPKMLGAKPSPKIATVDGKIYILGTKAHCGLNKIWHPAFECYDPSLGEWVQLPEPHHYSDGDDGGKNVFRASGLRSHFVFNRKIFIINYFGLSYFDVKDEVWRNSDHILGRYNRLKSPNYGSYMRLRATHSIAQGENGLVVAYTVDGILKAYLYGDDGEVRVDKPLDGIEDDFNGSPYKDVYVHFLGDRRFCIVLQGHELRGMCWVVRVTTFEVIVKGYSNIEARILNSHEYDLSLRAPDSEPRLLENVFIAKGGEQDFEDPLLVDAHNHWFTFHVSGPLPKPCSEFVAAAIEDKMYILGAAQGVVYLNDLYALDMSSWTWSKVNVKGNSIPWGVDKLLLIDGYTKRPFVTIEVNLFDLKRSTWSTMSTSGRGPVSMSGQSVTFVDDGRLIVFGGKDVNGNLLNDVHILDLVTLTWDDPDTLESSPCPRMDHAAAVLPVYNARYLFIFGGRSHNAYLNDLHVLDLRTMKWSSPSQDGDLPSPRAGHTGAVIGNNWFIAGGEDQNGNGVQDTIVLNMRVLSWTILTSGSERGPCDSKGLNLVSGSNRGHNILLSFGGLKNGGICTNKVNVLKPWCKYT